MATGIEAASLVLALLPLLVNQIDNYIQGFQRMTCFKPENYWREMESYRSILETERAILLNTLLIAVDGDTHYEYGDWTRDPGSAFWTSQDVWQKLRQKLGSSYEPFTSTINVLSDQLKNLSQKLGLSVDSTGRIDTTSTSSFEEQLKKVRRIFLHPVYKDLIHQVESNNRRLQTLVTQCNQIRQINAGRAVLPVSPEQHQIGRRLASSLYNAIINGDYWRCPCKSQHRIYFTFDSSKSPWTSDPSSEQKTKSRMTIEFKLGVMTLGTPNRWHEIQAEPEIHSLSQGLCRDIHITSSQQGLPIDENIPNIRFPQGVSGTQQGTVIGAENLPTAVQIANMCISLSAIGINEGRRMLLGYVTDTKHKHNIYHLRSNTESVRNMQSQTLEEILAILASSSEITGRETLPIVKRLRIAVDLACAVFQFDGSWLRRQWRARDIKVSQDSGDSTPKTYVKWDLNNEPRRLHVSQVPAGEPFIHLGFVLVELSQGKTLEALQTLEDHDQVQVVANRNTALRLLPLVEAHIGFGYRQVVDQCLNWPNCTVDNVDISKAYRSIIAPLVAYWRLFEGEKHLN
ncbi:hypothetical protein CBS147353_7050 [Aspergillus niger]|nr:hypothetical protein CBS147353_7050 [Aspergillus niger]